MDADGLLPWNQLEVGPSRKVDDQYNRSCSDLYIRETIFMIKFRIEYLLIQTLLKWAGGLGN